MGSYQLGYPCHAGGGTRTHTATKARASSTRAGYHLQHSGDAPGRTRTCNRLVLSELRLPIAPLGRSDALSWG